MMNVPSRLSIFWQIQNLVLRVVFRRNSGPFGVFVGVAHPAAAHIGRRASCPGTRVEGQRDDRSLVVDGGARPIAADRLRIVARDIARAGVAAMSAAMNMCCTFLTAISSGIRRTHYIYQTPPVSFSWRQGQMDHDHYSDDYILDILRSVKTIALTGASPNPARPSKWRHGLSPVARL